MLKLYNSLTKKKEEFKPLNSSGVSVYTCGPTVYDYVSIGNWRTYFLGDILVRTLKYLGYKVNYIMNITDVGHLTGDNLGDADTGEDRMEKASLREQKTAWDIANFYINDFKKGYKKLNLSEPKKFTKATDYIKEQIDLVKLIGDKGFSYKIADGIYFDVKSYEKAGNKYGEISTLDQRKEGARVAKNPDKKDPRDFALWKFSPKEKRQMEWDSPWGKGFPGWHIECSAMSKAELGEQIDIHIGGEDLRSTHHPNEIAQSEAASGQKPFVKYWLHGAFLLVDNGRMGKSLGNAYTIQDIEKKGFDPLVLRYFYLTAHYSKQLNFTWEVLQAAKETYLKLINTVSELEREGEDIPLSFEAQAKESVFSKAIEDNLNMPQALAQVWILLKDKQISDLEKYQLIIKWDKILGLRLDKKAEVEKTPRDVQDLLKKREKLRKENKYNEADKIRQKIEEKGFFIKDSVDTSRIVRK